MKARPILFSPEMVRALLEGRKTQTRRVCSPQPVADRQWVSGFKVVTKRATYDVGHPAVHEACPYGVPGDLLYVREAFRLICAQDFPDKVIEVDYRADNPNGNRLGDIFKPPKWKPGIHMPRHVSRITLRLTDVRVQRVQDISQRDVFAEGLTNHDMNTRYGGGSAQSCFAQLWDSINAERGYGWDTNQWVWALSFEVIKQNVDAYIYARGTGLQAAV